VPEEVDGVSFAPTLLGKKQEPRPFLYREFPGYGGQQCVRVGDWKGVRQNLNPPRKAAGSKTLSLRIELYDLKADPGETKDVSAAHPEMVAQMQRLLREQHTPSKLFPIAALDER